MNWYNSLGRAVFLVLPFSCVSAAVAEDLGVTLKKDQRQNAGVEVTSVTPKSLGAALELEPKDHLQTVNGKPVRSEREVMDAIGRERRLTLQILRVKDSVTTPLTIQADLFWPSAEFAKDLSNKQKVFLTDKDFRQPIVLKKTITPTPAPSKSSK